MKASSGQPASDHFDGTRFFNPGHPPTDRSLSELLRWKLLSRAARWPRLVPVRPVIPATRVDGLRVTMVGHATLLVQSGNLNVLTDPVWSERASPVSFAGPRRVTAPGVAFDNLPPIDVILLSHNHYDHCDLPTLRRLHERYRPLIIAPLGSAALLRRHLPNVRVATGDWEECIGIAPGADAHIVRAHHWSARGLRDRRRVLWGGFMLRTRAGLVYYSGDTGYGDGRIFRDMRDRHGSPDIAILPIGSYAPRWFMSPQHVDPAEAVGILLELDARRAIGMHWGCFRLSDEPRQEPPMLLRRALAERGLYDERFTAAQPGDVFGPADVVESGKLL